MESKNVKCCELLSLFASHAQKNIVNSEEKEWFNDFAFRFFEALQEKDKLCDKCLKFLEEREEDLNKTGFYDIIQIMKIREEADKLIRREKARQEKELANQLTEQANQGKTHEKDIEIAKFHEERGKKGSIDLADALITHLEMAKDIHEDFGLTIDDYDFAAYLRGKNYQPNQDFFYPKEKRNTIKEINISYKNLIGNLDLTDFVNLEELYCHVNQLTSLNLTNCQQLKKLDCSSNKLKDLILPSSAEQLTILSIMDNNLSGDCSLFSHLVNLENLRIGLEYLPDTKSLLLADKEQQIARLEAEILAKQEKLETSLSNQEQLKQEKTELEEKLTTLQAKYEELLEQATHRQELLKKLGEKNKALETLRNNCDYKPHQKLLVKYLLEAQEEFTRYNTYGADEKKKEIIKDLKEEGFKEVDNLCQLQTEITQLDKQLDKIRENARTIIEDLIKLTKGQFFLRGRQQNLILFGDINVQGGHAFIGNEFGDNTNLSHNSYITGIEEINEEFEALPFSKTKRALSVSSTTETQEENKIVKLDEEQKQQQAQILQKEPYGLPISIYQEAKKVVPKGEISPFINNFLKEYVKKKKLQALKEAYQRTAKIDYNYKVKKGKERELEIASYLKKIRPSLVVSNNSQNEFDEEIIVIPLSSKELNNIEPYQSFVKRNKKNGLDEGSKLLFNRLRNIEKTTRLGDYLGTVEQEIMDEVKEKLQLVLDLED
ncbi:3624_t:CDS:10 [Entrophospora sp. SA101]|nr:9937_t:CDS:10 [Entrophospora sp. SA101]CAJ0866525.1 3624_t:CDS:10 [Entrophospora sp. SA101]